MESSNEESSLVLATIGPTSVLGRVFAMRVLFCREARDELVIFMTALAHHWRRTRNLFGSILRSLLWVVNPRNPSVILAAIIGAMLWIRRAKMKTINAEQSYRKKFWSNLMTSALTYDEWVHAASMLEKTIDRKRDRELYDEDLVRAKLNDLRSRRLEGGVEDILFFLRADLVRNLGNMCNPELHKGRLQTPRVIQEYINEVRHQLRAVCETDSDEFSVDEKIAFITETRHAFGRTALLLSGGAALGAFHLGVVRTLIEHRLLPRVVAGASVGSITCSFCATRTWSELQSFFDDTMPPMHFFESMGNIIATAHRLLTKGAVHEIGSLQRKMRQLIGDLTFQEAYDLSGRVLGISVCSPRKHEPPRCLNYLTSPHVVIWSAVTASCAFPGLFEAQELMAKDRHGRLVPYHRATLGQRVGPEELNNMKRQWRDGTLESDLPMLQLKELFNVNHFIVSQANPHIAPLLRFKELTRIYGGLFAARLADAAEMEVKHRCTQALEMGFGLGGLAKLIAQPWEGDVTIVMPATFAQFAKIIQNLTPSEVRKAVMQGRRCTWAKLSAIQANCGIELMLDECVSELHRRRKIQKEDEEHFKHEGSRLTRSSTTKRIPSWNCLARSNSWSSLDDDGIADRELGGPWAGPAMRSLKPPCNSHYGSENDSGAENIDSSNLSWTRVGGPLMRSASADKFTSRLEIDGDSVDYVHATTASSDSGDGGDVGSGYASTPTKSGQAQIWDQRSGKRANKIHCCSPKSSDSKCEDSNTTEARDFPISVQLSLKRSASAILERKTSNFFAESDDFVSEKIYAKTVSECLQPDACSGSGSNTVNVHLSHSSNDLLDTVER